METKSSDCFLISPLVAGLVHGFVGLLFHVLGGHGLAYVIYIYILYMNLNQQKNRKTFWVGGC